MFQLTGSGMTLIEIAPGVDLRRDILDQMEFTPNISDDLKTMDARLFQEGLMGLSWGEMKRRSPDLWHDCKKAQ